jgi:hypothetical protein
LNTYNDVCHAEGRGLSQISTFRLKPLVFIVHALQNKSKLNQRMEILGNIYSGFESANALDCAENGAEWEAEAKQT